MKNESKSNKSNQEKRINEDGYENFLDNLRCGDLETQCENTKPGFIAPTFLSIASMFFLFTELFSIKKWIEVINKKKT